MKSPHDAYYRFKTKHDSFYRLVKEMVSLFSKLAREVSGVQR